MQVTYQCHADEIKQIMENAIEFKVPSVVDKGLGKSWGDAK
jgi:DNA polymerase I-like protein with 3'-5' exonuclease and polymerase domains